MVERRKRRPMADNQAGRPPLEELTEISPDMESVAQLTAAGHNATEIAEIMKWTTEKTIRHIKLSLVQARITLLLSDPLEELDHKRRHTRTAVYDSLIKKANNGELSEKTMLLLLRMTDPYERMDQMPAEQKRLTESKPTLEEGESIVGSNKSIFQQKGE